ncbi:class I SAM-dependent methyltransferase [Candidatus Methylospira mobilis]|uniref:Class I SAM-dependent methyltransferase n=1 Tax=Candidatus Methylospira mobilis TaxID=1808979 RepID=A0A5Q0BEX3_9GAMM|nr:class I SAM-dependent methyltransferase [Candidatus Methylospira mobilis]QFY42059.1 class I SAM-dependent methyltransferase [Candidatus Methylospira mobilis]WNV03066.1 class I SAM-dependent methyltransferase [Candidatus Methylospira mobilis]
MKNDVADNYGWSSVEAPCSCGYIAPFILKLLNRLDVKRVVDLGAGNGALCAMLAAQGYEVAGVEYDAKGVEIARSAYRDIHFYNFGVQDDPQALLAAERPFDAVISTEVIEHLFSPHLLPVYAKQILKDDGYLIISTPYHGYLKNLALSIVNKWDFHHNPLWHGGHIKFWSRETLTTLLVENGFSVIGFHGVGRIPYLWKSMVVVAKKSG